MAQVLLLYDQLHVHDSKAPQPILEKIWQQIINSHFLFYFVVEVVEQLVSSCNIIPNLTRAGRSIGLIENVVTHAAYRNKGYGKKVMEAAIAFAKNNDCYKVMLLSNGERKEAHHFYESLGFSANDKVGYFEIEIISGLFYQAYR